jgi:hypothetical protein
VTLRARNISLRSHFGADRNPAVALGTLYFALFAGDPLVDGVEPTSAGGYARVAKANDATFWGVIPSTADTATNADEVLWPAATAVWSEPSVSHWAIMDNASGGQVVYSGQLTLPIAVTGAGDVPRIPVNALDVTQL